MSRLRKIWTVLLSLISICLSVIMMIDPEIGIMLFLTYLTWFSLIFGIRNLLYYLSMGIHMVGGKIILYKALIGIDLGIMLRDASDLKLRYIVIYLLGIYLFSSGVSILRAMELKRMHMKSWKLQMTSGFFSLCIAILCLLNRGSGKMMIGILAMGYIYDAVIRIIHTLRNTEMIYIQ